MSFLARVLREPLLHFLLAGAAIFVAYGFLRGNEESDESRVVVTQAQIVRMAALWERARSRPPTPSELRGLVQEHIKEEIYYREARILGLDSDDTVIRRRLRQKMEFLTADAANAPAPQPADLAAYLERHREKYRIEPRVSFLQIFLKPEPGGALPAKRASSLLRELAAGEVGADISGLGDPTQLPADIPLSSVGEIARLFGRDFADGVVGLEPGKWAGPVESGYGAHLVLVRQRVAARDPVLEEIRDAVERDWVAERDRVAEEARFKRFLERYTIVVEWPQTARNEDRARQ